MTAQLDHAPQEDSHSPELCQYSSKKCWQLRVRKRNGHLHKLCEYHRQRANANQRRMEQKRVEQRRSQMRACLGVGHALLLASKQVDHAKNALDVYPADSTTERSPAEVCDEWIDLDVQLDAAMNCMIFENERLDREPLDSPADLCEADLYYCEQFMAELNQRVVE